MLPTLNFYGNHTLDFENSEINDLEKYAILELRKLPIPEAVLQIVYNSLEKQFQGAALSKLSDIEDWCPVSFPGNPDFYDKYPKKNILTFGPMGMRIVITPQHIILPSIIYERIDWYSPQNKEKVEAIRQYYNTVINHFGGDHALYVDEGITKKYDYSEHKPKESTLGEFEQWLIARYGTNKKTLLDYAHGEYPKYYIDHFPDLKPEDNQQ